MNLHDSFSLFPQSQVAPLRQEFKGNPLPSRFVLLQNIAFPCPVQCLWGGIPSLRREKRKAAQEFLKRCTDWRILRQLCVSHGRKKMPPDRLQYGLHIVQSACNGNHGILIRHNDAELAKGTVSTIGVMPAAPELIAVSPAPVAPGILSI